jgi:hypothetical protein
MAIVLNLPLKFNFFLSVSLHPSPLFSTPPKQALFLSLSGVFEMLRSFIWNYLFIENNYFLQKKGFELTSGFDFPCEFDLNEGVGHSDHQFITKLLMYELDIKDRGLLFKADSKYWQHQMDDYSVSIQNTKKRNLLRDGNSKDSTSSKTCFIMNNVFNFRR